MSDNSIVFETDNVTVDAEMTFVNNGRDARAIRDLAKEVRRLKVFELEAEWISVDDEMPLIGEHVLVHVPSQYGPPHIDVQMCHNDGRQRPTWSEGWNKGERWEITHWRRIRAPLKKQGQ